MALKQLILENFREKDNRTYELLHKNMIRGKNGSGKSTLKEAICFALCGTDSLGTRSPRHLIREGEKQTKVTLVTDKAEISRTLSQKGNGTLRVKRQGVSSEFTQTQFEGMVGSVDLFLCAFIPGHFQGLPVERQHKVISEVQPKIDRAGLFAELSGFELSPEEKLKYSLNRRTDLVINVVAQDRRTAENDANQIMGKIDQIKSLQPVEKPPECSEIGIVSRQEYAKKLWEDYESDTRYFEQQDSHRAKIESDNAEKGKRRVELDEKLGTLVTIEEFVPDSYDEEIGKLKVQVQLEPLKPALLATVDSDHCHTCGQAVGLKHREQVTSNNDAIMASHNEEVARAKETNDKIRDALAKCYAKKDEQDGDLKKIREENAKIMAIRNQLTSEISSLEPMPMPDGFTPVNKPDVEYDAEEHRKAQTVVEEYKQAMMKHQYFEELRASSEERLQSLEGDLKNIGDYVGRMRAIESTLKILPQEELKRQSVVFDMPTLQFEIGKEIEVFRDGTAYKLLSTGERMKADVEISVKFNQLMPKPVNVVFVDNVDLLDDLQIPIDTIQVFVAKVDTGIEEAQIVGL